MSVLFFKLSQQVYSSYHIQHEKKIQLQSTMYINSSPRPRSEDNQKWRNSNAAQVSKVKLQLNDRKKQFQVGKSDRFAGFILFGSGVSSISFVADWVLAPFQT